jgi:hypothetical protein
MHYAPKHQHKRLGLMEGQASIPDDFSHWSDEEEAEKLGLMDSNKQITKLVGITSEDTHKPASPARQ